jgi:outer membrane cobalamin receptor
MFWLAGQALAQIPKPDPRPLLSGTLTDAETGQPLAGVALSFKPTLAGTITDENGKFSIRLGRGRHEVTFSLVGYGRRSQVVLLNGDQVLAVSLSPRTEQLDEVVVTGKTVDHNVRDVEMGNLRLNLIQLKKIPIVFGEPDIIKTLTMQPGVSTVGEGAGGFNVRGGRTDQNLVLLDQAPVFNTSHLLGFFSNVNPDAVQEVSLYKGNVSALYGGRLASVLDMRTKSGNPEKWRYTGGISPISLRATAEGPAFKKALGERLTVLGSGRLAYPNWIMGLFPEPTNQNRAAFYDVNGKARLKVGKRHQVSLSGYRSFDNFKFPEDTLYAWQNNLATLQWNTTFSPKLSMAVYGIYSHYNFEVEGLRQFLTFRTRSAVRHRQAKADFFYNLTDKHRLEFGGGATWYGLRPGTRTPVGAESSVNDFALPPEQGRELAAYVNGEFNFTDQVSLQAGVRYVQYAQLGPGPQLQFAPGVPRTPLSITDTLAFGVGQPLATYGGLEPRLGLRVGLGPRTSLKMGYNRMRQYLHLISNTTAITPVDFWKVSNAYVPPQMADQWAVGLFRNFADNLWETSIEGYYKSLHNLVEYKNGAVLLLNPLLDAELLRARGRSYGVEVSLRKTRGKLSGQLAYTYSRALVAVETDFPGEQINGGAYFPANFDMPHNLSLSQVLQLGKGWTFNTNFVFISGRPATYPDGLYRLNDLVITEFSRRNEDRLPNYHRLDISLVKDTRRSPDQARYLVWNISFYNLYGRRNAYSVFFTQSGVQARSFRLAVFGTVIPSVTCNVHF